MTGNETNPTGGSSHNHAATNAALQSGDGPLDAAVPVAEGRYRRQGQGRRGDGPAAARQGGDGLRPHRLWPHRRCAGAEGCHRDAGNPDGAGDRLRAAARGLGRIRRTARRAVRQGAAARRARGRVAHLPPSACAEPALSSRSADGRVGPRTRSRHGGHPVGAAARGVQRGADGDRAAAGHRHHLASVRLAVRRDHLRRGGELCAFHHDLCRLARPHPPHHERHRQRRQHEGAGQPAQLRDGEVLRQRATRGGALRRRVGAV